MKWISLAIIAFLTICFWPESSDKKDRGRAKQKRVTNSSSQKPWQRSRTSRNSKKRLNKKELGRKITALWSEISDDPRDPKVVKFIRLLREFGKRNEKEAFDLLNGLDRQDREEQWLMAKMAVAGGWAMRDPASASIALLEVGTIIPEGFMEGSKHIPAISPTVPMQSNPFRPDPSRIAILRQASQIFKAWSQIDPEEATRFANNLPKNESNRSLRRMLFKHVTRKSLTNDGLAEVNRLSIDAILNNPLRTSSDSRFGREIYGDMLNEGEEAFTFEEWAARNSELARVSLKNLKDDSPLVAATPVWRREYLQGLFRTDPDYLGLLELGFPDFDFDAVYSIAQSVNKFAADEAVWQLDGRESSWTLNFEERKTAMEKLIADSNFSVEQGTALSEKMKGNSTNFDFLPLLQGDVLPPLPGN